MSILQNVAIILPAYNEENTIVPTIEAFNSALPCASIWVINNRSTDATALLAQKAIDEIACRGGVINELAPGKGHAIRRAFLDVDADIYVMADADMTYPAGAVLELIKHVSDNEADVVVGDRHALGCYSSENKRPLHEFGNRLVCCLVNKLFGAQLRDIMSGYRVMSRRFVKTYPVLVGGFELETDMTIHALDKRFRILEVPVLYRDRPIGSFSKLSTLKDGARVVVTIFNIFRYYRPLAFFGALSFLFMAAGLLSAIPVINDWFSNQYIYHVPLAILATGLEIVSVVFFAVGLILDSISKQDKRNFERDVLLTQRKNLHADSR